MEEIMAHNNLAVDPNGFGGGGGGGGGGVG